MRTSTVVLFDQDDTVVDTRSARKGATEAVIGYISQRVGLPVTDLVKKYNQAMRATDGIRFLDWTPHNHKRSQISYFLSLIGVYDERIEEELTHAYFETRDKHLQLIKEASETLQELSNTGYVLGITTDGHPKYQPEILAKLGILQFFNNIFARQYGYKGQPEFFHRVIAELGVSPEKIAHVGDNPITDVVIPRSTGLYPCILFDPNNVHPELTRQLAPDHRITSLIQLLDILL